MRSIQAEMVSRGSLLVAFSGGVDSALVAHLACGALGDSALAVIAATESMARSELNRARATAAEIGIRCRAIRYSDLGDPEYIANLGDRCYRCRRGMAAQLRAVAVAEGLEHLADGAILDDLGDVRPGMAAMEEAGFWHPLVDAGLTKADVRHCAMSVGLSVHDKPTNACLSSRLARGTPVTIERLRQVEAGEDFLRGTGFRQVRVRLDDAGARVEVGRGEVSVLLEAEMAAWVTSVLKEIGFRRVELDPRGYREGNLSLP